MNDISWIIFGPIRFSNNDRINTKLSLVINDKVYYVLNNDTGAVKRYNKRFLVWNEFITAISEDEAKKYNEYKYLVEIKLKHESVLYQELIK